VGDGLVSQYQWRVAAASVQGASHQRTASACQDAHKWATLGQGLLLAAVADGAGSAPLASEGAAVAVSAAIQFASQKLSSHPSPHTMDDRSWQALLTETIAAARNALDSEATQRSAPLRDLATTLLVVVASRELVAGVQIGDGAIVVADALGGLQPLSRPAQGEYLNETVFLTSEEAFTGVQPAVWRGNLTHLAVLSDGLQMVALRMPGGEPHPGFFTPLFRFLAAQSDSAQANEAVASFLASPRLRERTDDDVTLILASLAG
jgi:hypothetical protein